MTKRKRQTKPYDPAAQAIIHQRRDEAREMRSRGLEVNVDKKTEEVLGAWRPDCFALLLKGRQEEANAVQWLEQLIRTATGENAQERGEFVNRSCEGAPGQAVSMAMIEAGETVAVVQENMAPQHARMLFGLLKPDEGLLTRWRDVVKRTTGETNPQAQGAAVRAACTSLVWVHRNIGLLTKARRERRIAA